MLKDKLEIFIPTYNRCSFLESTFKQLLAERSPVKDIQITILDNRSTDGTQQLVTSYSQRFPNIKYIRRNYNVGSNINIASAFEMAEKEYFWVLADDDDYDFTHWANVEKAMEEKKSLIVVNREIWSHSQPPSNPAELFRLLTFCPASIHRKDTLDAATMINIYYSAQYWFADLGAVATVINKKLPIAFLGYNIVKTGKNDNQKGLNYHRTMAGLAFPYRMTFFNTNFLKCVSLLNDPIDRAQAARFTGNKKRTFFSQGFRNTRINIIGYHNCLQNHINALEPLSFLGKINYLLGIVAAYVTIPLLFPYYLHKYREFKQMLSK